MRGDHKSEIVIRLSSGRLSHCRLYPRRVSYGGPGAEHLVGSMVGETRERVHHSVASFSGVGISIVRASRKYVVVLYFGNVGAGEPFSNCIYILPRASSVFELTEKLLPRHRGVERTDLFFSNGDCTTYILPCTIFSERVFFILDRFNGPIETSINAERCLFRRGGLVDHSFVSSLAS